MTARTRRTGDLPGAGGRIPERAGRRATPCAAWFVPWLLGAVMAVGSLRATETVVFEEIPTKDFKAGERVLIRGRYVEMRDDRVMLFGSSASFLLDGSSDRRTVLELVTSHETLSLEVTWAGRDAEGLPQFRIESVTGGPSIAELGREEFERLRKRSRPADDLLTLATRTYSLGESLERDDLRKQAESFARSAMEVHAATLGAKDVQGRLAFVARIGKAIPRQAYVMDLLVLIEREFPDDALVRGALLSLNCRNFEGQWMTYADFKARQGYEERAGRWVKPEERELDDVVDRLQTRTTEAILRRRLDREYALLASSGQVATGMKLEEVHDALGFPERVYRGAYHDSSGAQRIVTQWVYEGQRSYYFLDDLLIKTPDDDSELR